MGSPARRRSRLELRVKATWTSGSPYVTGAWRAGCAGPPARRSHMPSRGLGHSVSITPMKFNPQAT